MRWFVWRAALDWALNSGARLYVHSAFALTFTLIARAIARRNEIVVGSLRRPAGVYVLTAASSATPAGALGPVRIRSSGHSPDWTASLRTT